MTRLIRVAALLCAGLAGSSTLARADIIITPFVGKTFAAHSPALLSEPVNTQKWTLGAGAGWLGSGILGAELDFGYVPRFFDAGLGLTTPGNNVTTLTGNVIVALPLSITRDSLRPYVTAGAGLLHAGADDIANSNAVDSNFGAISVGGGAIGFLTPRAGVRFDLRHIRSTSRSEDIATGDSQPRLSFWRATVGVALRY